MISVLPWLIFDLFMNLTFNNIVNVFAKIPLIGWLLGMILYVPFVGLYLGISIWSLLNSLLVSILIFRGNPNSEFCIAEFMKTVEVFEGNGVHSMIIARWFYEHCQWIWGSGCFLNSSMPWMNGVWAPATEISVPLAIVKLFFLMIPYSAIFIIPFWPIILSFGRWILAILAKLPAISGNGKGRD